MRNIPPCYVDKALFEVFLRLDSRFKHFQCIVVYQCIMSWAKESAKVGLAGLTPLEAARGAMFLREFQDMPDPLKQEPIEITSPEDIPMVSVSN